MGLNFHKWALPKELVACGTLTSEFGDEGEFMTLLTERRMGKLIGQYIRDLAAAADHGRINLLN
jgi:hypothetical protein